MRHFLSVSPYIYGFESGYHICLKYFIIFLYKQKGLIPEEIMPFIMRLEEISGIKSLKGPGGVPPPSPQLHFVQAYSIKPLISNKNSHLSVTVSFWRR